MSAVAVAVPYQDCQALHDIRGGPEESASRVVEIIAPKTSAELKQLREAFKDMYKEELWKFLESTLQGNLQIAVSLWIRDPAERDAIIAKQALERAEPDFFAITEILCARDPAEIMAIREAYAALFKISLENDIATETVGCQQKLLFALAKARRSAFSSVDEALAKSDAKKLFDAKEGRIGIDEAAIVKLLCDRNLNHLRAALLHYKNLYGHHILEALKKDRTKNFEGALRAIFECISSPDSYFCDLMRCALNAQTVDESTVIRILVTRAEVDVDSIRAKYLDKFGCSLDKSLSCRISSGPLRDFLGRLSLLPTQ